MFKQTALTLLFAAAAVAAPEPLMERGGAVNCAAVNSIVTIMKQQAVATPFCSSYLKIPHPTVTTTITSTPCAVTSTTTVVSTDIVTTTSVSYYSTVTTVYPVVAISTTSTCALSATVVQTPYNKRGATTSTKCTTSTSTSTSTKPTTTTTKCTTTTTPVSKPPIGVPTCLTKFIQSDVSSACSCLSIPTQTYTSTSSTTLKPSTIISTVCSTAKSTVTTVVTSTTFTSTYSATQYYTSTFTVLPPPSSTIVATAAPTETFGAYAGLDFSGQDIQNFFCYPNGPAAPAPFTGTPCTTFTDCVNECAYYNANNLGSSSNTTCGAVIYNAPADASSGSCYLKTGINGCGGTNSQTTLGVILPLIATDPQ